MSEQTLKLNDKQYKQLDTDLKGIDGAINKVAENISPADTSLAAKIDELSENLGKWTGAISTAITDGLAAVAAAIANNQPPPPPGPQLRRFLMSFVVKDNNPDVGYTITLGDVTDAEGNPIADAALDIEISSDNPAAVTVTADPADSKKGTVSFGSPGNATITANVSTGGTLLGSGVAGFVVTVGDPAAISSVSLAFDGLTEAPEA